MTDASARRPALNPFVKLALEMGPLGLFFLAYFEPALFRPLAASILPPDLLTGEQAGLFISTPVLMVSVVAALAASYALSRRVPIMPVVTVVVVVALGGLTLYLKDPTFIKLKPTIVNTLFGSALLIALAFGKPLLPIMLDSVINLTEQGWKILTLRWGLFFFFLAGLNELVWRTQTTEFWVSFKVFGTMPITMLFALSQTPLILKHELKADADADAAAGDHW